MVARVICQMASRTTRIVAASSSQDEAAVDIVGEVEDRVRVRVNDNLVVRARTGASRTDSLLLRMHKSPWADLMLKCASTRLLLCFAAYC
jgi:hypothetical protein